MKVVALFGPTGVGKTSVAIELAELLRREGEDPVAVNCDSMQVYRGLEIASAAPTAAELERLEHRLLGVVPASEEFSAGRYSEAAHREIDGLLDEGRRPLVIGGTGLYLRAALAELDLRPPVPAKIRAQVESELEGLGPARLHARLPPEARARIHPNDRKRIARVTELQRAGIAAHEESTELWTERVRRPSVLVGLVMDRDLLATRIDARVEEMFKRGAAEELRRTREEGMSRTASALLGLDGILAGDRQRVAIAHRRYARRQMTWMRKMAAVEILDRGRESDRAVAEKLRDLILG